MYVTKKRNCLPIYSWCKDIEDEAMEQLDNLSRHPVIVEHIVALSDCHKGYGMPIGGVIACKNAVIPNAVGVDIGCGMISTKTNFEIKNLTTENIKKIMGIIREMVPVGFNHHKTRQSWDGFDIAPDVKVVQQNLNDAEYQLGTLGGGNHFIELQKSDDGFLNIMIHSGSRNFGFKIANEFHKMALNLNEKWHSNIPHKELAFLPMDDQLGIDYIDAMNFALDFAFENRRRMMQAAMTAISGMFKDTEFFVPINTHHNFASIEHHFGQNLWIHRKGATKAEKLQYGIIPGSMGTSSYIVEGLGNPKSFHSCSHGAGRVMSRTKASETLTEEECNKAMEGIVFGRWGKNRKGNMDFGEAPQAYKDIDEVMKAQEDLVQIRLKLDPIGVIKG